MNRFANKTVLVTGAVGAVGGALVHAFAGEGANVVVAARHEGEGSRLAAELPGKAIFVNLDVTSEDAWTNAVQVTEDQLGPVDVLVNNAAYLHEGTVESIEPAAFRKVIDTNLTGAYLGIRAVVPSMRRAGSGSIVNISSIAGLAPAPGLAAYGASKWGIRGLMRTAAKELSRDHIRVNSVHPGIINTPLAYSQTGEERVPVDNFPIPRQATTEEIAGYVLFVASEDAAFSTGVEFIADGGFLLGPNEPAARA
ncbi:SDR family NAD(P)-dependent oxidoreductase [Streptomyces sp. NPDC006655]|uniref:SDR family NAD(P)-dependent oxidoreductase n=1 Tax=Streptomyces sp. NPDC006655 TaxID=3156898 RepID=UPI00345197EB